MYTLPIDKVHSWTTRAGHPSTLRVRIWVLPAPGGVVCLLTEGDANQGETITSAIEGVLEHLVDIYDGVLDHDRTLWVEHYTGTPAPDVFHRVRYTPGAAPTWERLSLRFMTSLIRSATMRINLTGDPAGDVERRRKPRTVFPGRGSSGCHTAYEES